MAYDASEFVKALEPPKLTVPRPWWQLLLGVHHVLGRTKTYTGRILSHREWEPLRQRWAEAQQQESVTNDVAEKLIRDTCGAIGIPAKVVLSLPGSAMWGALTDFLACLSRAHTPGGGTPEQTTTHRSPRVTASRNGSRTKTNEHGMLVK